MKRFVLVCTIALVTGSGPTLRAQEKPVPRYDGKSLEYWVEKLQKAETPGERNSAAEAIKAFGSDATPALPQLVEMLDDHSEDFRFLIVDVLKSLGADKSAVPILVRSLEKKTAKNPQEVIWTLAAIGPEAGTAVGVLSTLLEDRKLRFTAAGALGAIGPAAKPAIPALSEAINRELSHREPGFFFCIQVTETLGKIGPASVPQLKELLEREDFNDGMKKYLIFAIDPLEGKKIPVERR